MQIGSMEIFLLVATVVTAIFVGLYIARVNRGYEEREKAERERARQERSNLENP